MRIRSTSSPTPTKPRGPKPTREAGAMPLIDPRQDPRGPRHVAAVLVAEGFGHQRLLAPDAKKEQRSEPDQTRRPRDPIRQQQRLRQRPQPERRIHGMAHATVDA